MRLQDLFQGGLCKVPVTTLLTLPARPICVVYPVLDTFHITHHDCIHCPRINFPGKIIYQHMNSICHSQLTAYPLAMRSCSPPPPPWSSSSPVACKVTLVTQLTPFTSIFVLMTSPSGGESQAATATPLLVAGKANPETQAILTPLMFIWKKGPSERVSQANLVIPAAVLWCTTRIRMMVKQKGCKVAAAAARANKD